MPPDFHEQGSWPTAMATVTSCTYTAGAGRAMAFGAPTKKHFLIAYNYWANGELHNGEFRSATAIPQGKLFPIAYNPDALHEHDHEQVVAVPSRRPVIVIGVIGSIVLSLAWFGILYGCHGR
jgi:hypothetical protein